MKFNGGFYFFIGVCWMSVGLMNADMGNAFFALFAGALAGAAFVMAGIDAGDERRAKDNARALAADAPAGEEKSNG